MTARIVLRPVAEGDLAMFRRFAVEPGLIGLDWAGFRDAQAPGRRFAADGYLGADDGRLIVDADGQAAQRALERAGFRSEGVVRACEFRDGAWRDGHLFSRLRTDPRPDPGVGGETGAGDPGAATPGSSPRH